MGTWWNLGVEYFQPSQVNYTFPPFALVPLVLSTFLAEQVICQSKCLTLVMLCLIEGPWIPSVLDIFEDGPCHCNMIKYLIRDMWVDCAVGDMWSPHLTLLLPLEVCCTDRGFLPGSVRGWGELSIYNKGFPAMFEWMGRLVLERTYQTMPFLPLN